MAQSEEVGTPAAPAKVLTVFTLVMITTGIITSINNAPSMAEFGFSLVFIYIVVAFVFLLPSSLIAAELATGWPDDGGVYVWVREAFGERWGFVAVWQQWAENVIWFPSVLSVIAVTIAYAWNPELQSNKWYVFVAVNGVFWAFTVVNLYGMRASAVVATIGTLFGRVFPIVFIAGLAIMYLARGDPSRIEFSLSSFVPDVTNPATVAFVIGAFFTFAGIEASANHAASARNPRRDYPRAIIFSAIFALFLVTLVALAVAIVVPQHDISLVAGFMQALQRMLDIAGVPWLLPVVAAVITLGMLGEINNWIPAPTRGLHVAGRAGNLPRVFHRVNTRGVHVTILLTQAVLVSIFSSLTLVFQVQTAFWILTVVPSQLYIIMYVLMWSAGVRLRYTHPEVPRRYRVPFGNFGIWALAVTGIVASALAIGVGFIPPATVPIAQRVGFFAVVIITFVALAVLPLVIYQVRRPSWHEQPAAAPDPQPEGA